MPGAGKTLFFGEQAAGGPFRIRFAGDGSAPSR
jgi:hypothetical protein